MSHTIDIHGVFVVSERFPSRVIENEMVLVQSDDREVLHFNQTAAWQIQQLDGCRSLADIIDLSVERFDAEREIIAADLLDMMEPLIRGGVVVPVVTSDERSPE
ncbi:MAG: PqqD family protein [Lentisphaeria bacterium]|nr:PqqD family protein [Lentisphaeria bacterium]